MVRHWGRAKSKEATPWLLIVGVGKQRAKWKRPAKNVADVESLTNEGGL